MTHGCASIDQFASPLLISAIKRFKFVKHFTKFLAKVYAHLVNTHPDGLEVRLRRPFDG